MPKTGDIKVKITLSNLPEHRRRPYCVTVLEWRDSWMDEEEAWRYYREPVQGLSARIASPGWFKNLRKALEYKDSILFQKQYNEVRDFLKTDTTSEYTVTLEG